MDYFLQRLQYPIHRTFKSIKIFEGARSLRQKVLQFFEQVRSIGYTTSLEDFEKRKLRIFNQLNFFQLVAGIITPAIAIMSPKFPVEDWYIAMSPALISIVVLILNAYYKYEAALLCYFISYPVFTCILYINGLNFGIELSFILYGILAVFFLKDIGYMLFAISLCMVSYFALSVTWKDYKYQLEVHNYVAYLFNQLLVITYIFYGLYLIKRENADYQFSIVSKNRQLHAKNLEIGNQKKEISHKARLLKKQTAELQDLNAVKNKLFSIISHDLKTPMYALRNLFSHAQQFDLKGEELKEMLPDVINDLNYTTALMENLLQWAKFQMQANTITLQKLDVSEQVNEVVKLMHLQFEAKKIYIEKKNDLPVHAWADKNIINLVLRNLVSNAIKFTPENGRIIIGTYESASCVEVFVQDTGKGISGEEMKKINSNNFYTTNGTNSEGGTGLGLMLCREFLAKNDGHMMVESEPGTGSTFSFTLPLAK